MTFQTKINQLKSLTATGDNFSDIFNHFFDICKFDKRHLTLDVLKNQDKETFLLILSKFIVNKFKPSVSIQDHYFMQEKKFNLLHGFVQLSEHYHMVIFTFEDINMAMAAICDLKHTDFYRVCTLPLNKDLHALDVHKSNTMH